MKAPPNGRIVCFGEMMLRLAAPAGEMLSDARSLQVQVGGAEANVAAALAQLGGHVEMVTALPEDPLGDLACGALRRHGVRFSSSLRAKGRMGLYFLEAGAAPRAGRIVYDRAGSLFSARAADFDWPAILEGAAWLHLSGINAALGNAGVEAVQSAIAAARAAGVTLSFDCNFRPSLWEGREQEAPSILTPIAAEADVLFGSHRDIAFLTGAAVSGDTDQQRRHAAEMAFAAFPRLSMFASTGRIIDADGTQTLSARVDTPEDGAEAEPVRLGTIIDRIGSGDAFVAGVIDGCFRGIGGKRLAERGLAAAALKHMIHGDQWVGTADDLDAFDALKGSDVRR